MVNPSVRVAPADPSDLARRLELSCIVKCDSLGVGLRSVQLLISGDHSDFAGKVDASLRGTADEDSQFQQGSPFLSMLVLRILTISPLWESPLSSNLRMLSGVAVGSATMHTRQLQLARRAPATLQQGREASPDKAYPIARRGCVVRTLTSNGTPAAASFLVGIALARPVAHWQATFPLCA
jgi:hypothetical protein